MRCLHHELVFVPSAIWVGRPTLAPTVSAVPPHSGCVNPADARSLTCLPACLQAVFIFPCLPLLRCDLQSRLLDLGCYVSIAPFAASLPKRRTLLFVQGVYIRPRWPIQTTRISTFHLQKQHSPYRCLDLSGSSRSTAASCCQHWLFILASHPSLHPTLSFSSSTTPVFSRPNRSTTHTLFT